MQYTLLLWPHANARYQLETRRLALCELNLMLRCVAPGAAAMIDEDSDMPSLKIESPTPLDDRAMAAIRGHSLRYGLFERREDGTLYPLAGREKARMGADLPAILKYKGKTNELFLQLLMNAALYSGDCWREEAPLEFLDPMCGRATAPFIALNRGWNALGADIDKNDLKEAEKFEKRYLEYHRCKYNMNRESRTVAGGPAVPVTTFEAAAPEEYKAGKALRLSLANCDAARLDRAFGRTRLHIIACDLPYGVQHEAQAPRGKNPVEALLAGVLPGWARLLRPGGAVAVSFNAQTLRRDRVRALMADAGLQVCAGGDYDGFEHWVEQAITRDIAVCRKKG